VKITFYAHASFRLEADGLTVITDPYTPGPQACGFDPIDEPADLVINALELPPDGMTVRGVLIRSFPAMESYTFDFGRDPDANALYLFTLGGIRVLHMGDIGNPVSPAHLDALRGNVDLLLALAGAHATIALDDLDAAIAAIQPRAIIPMHYYSPRGVLNILPVDDFLARYPSGSITRLGGPQLELTPESLPKALHIYVLEQSR
jgi:L-ascorbate metabolism protein UlaG (beta-lactamase superfamily)